MTKKIVSIGIMVFVLTMSGCLGKKTAEKNVYPLPTTNVDENKTDTSDVEKSDTASLKELKALEDQANNAAKGITEAEDSTAKLEQTTSQIEKEAGTN